MLKTSKILCCRHSTPLHWIQCFHKDSNFKFEFEFKRCSKHSISCVAGIQHLCTTRWLVVGRRLPRSWSRGAPTWVSIIIPIIIMRMRMRVILKKSEKDEDDIEKEWEGTNLWESFNYNPQSSLWWYDAEKMKSEKVQTYERMFPLSLW